MKRLILLELTLLFLATTFSSNPPPGWFQQTLPVNDLINDIFFLDSLNGWVVTAGNYNANDTAYIMNTTNSGNNWVIQNKGRENLNAVQFLDNNTGYAVGGTNGTTLMSIYKTSNGGTNWTALNNLVGIQLKDLFFINNDTGWICDDDPFFGGLYKTTNGGGSWQEQLNESYGSLKIFFINKDTGWVISSGIGNLYRTSNGGVNWNLQHAFPGHLNDVLFINKDLGCVSGGVNYRTTDGGFNWTQSNDGGIKLTFANDSIGWAGSNFNKVMKTSTGGISWYRQPSPIFDNSSSEAIDTLKAWAGGTGLVYTSDGGGPVGINSTVKLTPEKFNLYQNYPNPFNPITNFKFQISNFTNVRLIVYDLSGKLISTVINQRLSPGVYEENFDGSNLSSGVYFYSLIVDGNIVDTKKMLLVK